MPEPSETSPPAPAASPVGPPVGEVDACDLSPYAMPSPAPVGVSLHTLVPNERAIARVLEGMLSRSGLTLGEAARALGVTPNAVRQYLRGRRHRPSLEWFIRFARVCGATVRLEWPPR